MTPTATIGRHLGRLALLLPTLAFAAESAAPDAGAEPRRERTAYRMNLGCQSGCYTDWEAFGIDSFAALETTILVDEIYGKPKDRWAALVRVTAQERKPAAKDAEQRFVSLLLVFDRKTKVPVAQVQHNGREQKLQLDVALPKGKPITLRIEQAGPEVARIRFGSVSYDVPIDFAIEDLRVLASGVSAEISPFVVERFVDPR